MYFHLQMTIIYYQLGWAHEKLQQADSIEKERTTSN